MSFQQESDDPVNLTITLELAPEDSHDADPALVNAVGRDAADALRNDGYTIKSVYTGQRGGFLVDVVIPLLAAAWAQRDAILADGSALVTIFTPVVLIARHLQKAHKRQMGKDIAQQPSIKISVEIDGASISIEVPNLETAEAAMKLARRFQTKHPAVASKVTSQSKTKLKGNIPKKPPHRRR